MSQTRFFKSVITPTLVQPTENHGTGVASGVWSLQDQARARRGGVWPEAGVADPDKFVENNFSTFLYTGSGSNRDIVNGIDLANKGGLVWIKRRDDAEHHYLYDTARGVNEAIFSSLANAQTTQSNSFTAFNSNGFSLGSGADHNVYGDGTRKYVSWTFKKASKFFDIVTYTGNGTSGRTVSHNLGAVPGMIIVKATSQSDQWTIFHRGTGNTKQINFTTNAEYTASSAWNDTDPTATEFTVGNAGTVNQNGSTYVAYLFGHDTSSDGMIQCGTYQSDGAAGEISVDLGFEPQFVMAKAVTTTGNWHVQDTMRGMAELPESNNPYLQWNTTDSESADGTAGGIVPTPNGFRVGLLGDINIFNATQTYIYMAIRRGPMATPTAASDVFDIQNSTTTNPAFTSNNIIDTAMFTSISSNDNRYWSYRLRHKGYLYSNGTNTQPTGQNAWDFGASQFGHYHNSGGLSGYIGYFWSRAPGYHDVVAYEGNATSGRNITHNLGVVPEMMWVKSTSHARQWAVYHKDLGNAAYLNLDDTGTANTSQSGYWNNTTPTSSVFTLGNSYDVNNSNYRYVNFLFATLAGVSKVGSYTGDNSSGRVIDCGFTSGAKFVIIKPASGVTGGWSLYDTTRGINAGDDPVYSLNNQTAQSSPGDDIDADSSGFIVNQNALGNYLNANGVTYIFYAIAT